MNHEITLNSISNLLPFEGLMKRRRQKSNKKNKVRDDLSFYFYNLMENSNTQRCETKERKTRLDEKKVRVKQ